METGTPPWCRPICFRQREPREAIDSVRYVGYLLVLRLRHEPTADQLSRLNEQFGYLCATGSIASRPVPAYSNVTSPRGRRQAATMSRMSLLSSTIRRRLISKIMIA